MRATMFRTVADALTTAALQLEGGSLVNARGEAERIVGDAVGLARAELYLQRDRALNESESAFIANAVVERLSGKPLQYILGHQPFRHLDLACRSDVFIPRPETELLVEAAVGELRSRGGWQLVLDIGCGSGAIAVSIAHEYQKALVFATDVSEAALDLTKHNARRSGIPGRVHVVLCDLYECLESLKRKLDMIVSNPPYIRRGELASLQREVQFEPKLALDGGEDGLSFYRAIVRGAPDYLKSGGVLLLEVGHDQASEVVALCRESGAFADIEVRRDYQDIERIVIARKA